MAQDDTRSTPEASDLCTACGLCCDGTLFARMPIIPDEFALAARAGSPIWSDGERSYTRQPCAFLVDRCCTVYDQRYAVCVRYRCRLLRDLDEGSVAFAVAAGHVVEARRLRDAARATAADAGASEVDDWRMASDPAVRRRLAVAHLAALTLDWFLDRHFRRRPKRDRT